jgi:hypothetical protein
LSLVEGSTTGSLSSDGWLIFDQCTPEFRASGA